MLRFQERLGLQQHFDPRNIMYRIKDVLGHPGSEMSDAGVLASRMKGDVPAPLVHPRHKYHYDKAWQGDQGYSSACTGFALTGAMADGPVTHPGQNPILSPMQVYEGIQAVDRAEGRDYGPDGGATSLAMAKFAKRQKWIGEYRWGYTLDEFIAAITTGPVLLGINWYSGMDNPGGKDATIRVKGSIRGGHEIIANGADFVRGLVRLKNSWGTEWGENGHARLPFEDLERLIAEDGDVCLFRELKTDDPRTKRDESIIR